jgi:hypothetical protein
LRGALLALQTIGQNELDRHSAAAKRNLEWRVDEVLNGTSQVANCE